MFETDFGAPCAANSRPLETAKNSFWFRHKLSGSLCCRVAKATRLWNSTLLCFRFRMWRLWFTRTSHSMTCKNVCLVRHMLLFHPNYWVFYEDKHGFFLNMCRHETQGEHYRKRKRLWWITCWDLNRKHYTKLETVWTACQAKKTTSITKVHTICVLCSICTVGWKKKDKHSFPVFIRFNCLLCAPGDTNDNV